MSLTVIIVIWLGFICSTGERLKRSIKFHCRTRNDKVRLLKCSQTVAYSVIYRVNARLFILIAVLRVAWLSIRAF
jgi:hypothetical protein